MNFELNRLNTFNEWPENAAVNPSRIAKGGFYYTGQGTNVQCFFCGVTISEWNYGDQVMARHREARPECPFVLNPTNTCNVPLLDSNNSTPSLFSLPPPPEEPRIEPSDRQQPTTSSPVQSQNPRIEYGTYEQRLRSFGNWPATNNVTPESLARAGFYYLQQEDMVECVYCRGIMSKWEPGDDPYNEHRNGFPHCDFFNHRESNSALTTEEKEELANVKLLSGTTADLHKLGIQKHTGPKQLKYATYEGRLRTFQGWPDNLQQTPDMLSTAGFYYVGSGDQVRCFHCDGGLHNWEADDDPWTEHARWFPKCGFVSIVRGQDFIQHCIDNRPPLDPLIFLGVPENGEDVGESSTSQPASSSSSSNSNSNSNSNSVRIRHEVTDTEVEELLHSAPAITALQLGLNLGRVKTALRQRLERFGVPYTNSDQLIEHVRRIHLTEENNGLENNTETSSSELAALLSKVITVQSSSKSRSQGQNRSDIVKQLVPMSCNGESQEATVMSLKKDKRADAQTDNGPLSLEEENRRLREARLCKICMDREVSVVFLPCGHLATCVQCAPSLTDCPMCRQEIRATVRTFLA
ncbi:Similar to Diap2: Death-associated inhibitor of apoptosis 2 (Drosophila melanogaster) [Cotesia congregata]|uniref:Similar to Diap2: Death-associated inhibitor of apoptosis 2 (Drosophila melanogaster) n=1 Tax=Cotesia congregata TaxID=51543 RepID=A0A8J2HK71_COTCN|nr:Similar to Diap2: Death-associated inhibitor of apoptosis 2 (Drosophila melanogaster) [Cotesia congregata]